MTPPAWAVALASVAAASSTFRYTFQVSGTPASPSLRIPPATRESPLEKLKYPPKSGLGSSAVQPMSSL